MQRMLFTAIVLAFWATCTNALTIDDFGDGAAVLVGTGPANVDAEQNGLDENHVIGGMRRIGYVGNAGAELIVDTDSEQVIFPVGGSVLLLYYGVNDPLGVDLTADGSNEFRLTFTGIEPEQLQFGSGIFALTESRIGTSIGDQAVFADSSILHPVGNSLQVRVPFSDFFVNGDPTKLQEIGIEIRRPLPTQPFTISGFRTVRVPESATVALVFVAAVGLACSRSRFSGWR